MVNNRNTSLPRANNSGIMPGTVKPNVSPVVKKFSPPSIKKNNKKINVIRSSKLMKKSPVANNKKVSVVKTSKSVKKTPQENIKKNNVKKDVVKVKPVLQEVKIRKIGVLSVATTFAIVGVFTGLLFSLILIPLYSFFLPYLESLGLPDIFLNSWTALLLIPLFGIKCFILGTIFGLFYNLASAMTKGIKLFS